MSRLAAIASLFVSLDRGSPTFLQRQLRDGLARAVASGVLTAGTRLPSTRALAAQLAVSRTTIVAALAALVAEGTLEARPRSGIFVARPAVREAVTPSAPARRAGRSSLRLSRRADEMAREAEAAGSLRSRPLAFRLSRPALDAFPVREWSRILARRAARVTTRQLDYNQESVELRSAIAELVSSARGMRVHGEQVLIFGGGQRALEFAASALLDRGAAAWIEEPGYPGARTVLRSAGARVVPVPVDEDGLVVSRGVALAGDARLVYVTPSCQFPLGVTMTVPRRKQLLAWARRAGACVLEDDDDCEFRYAGAALPAIHALDAHGHVVYVSSFSRTMFPAIRLGFLVAPEGLVDPLRAARATLEEQVPSLSQLALADFIAEGHYARHLRRMGVLYRARRDALVAALRASGAALTVRAADSGLHLVADLAAGAPAPAVAAAAARRGVEAAPLARFYAAGHTADNALVLGFGAVLPDRALPAAQALAAAIAEVAGRTVSR